MTKKRFLLKKCKLYDMGYNKDIPIATFRNVDDAEVICSWLNELYKENEQVKADHKRQENEIKMLRTRTYCQDQEIQKLLKKIEELKCQS